MTGATENTLIINDVNGSHNGAYFVRVSNSRGVAESQVVQILVGDAPKIAEQPVSKKTVKDQATFLSVKISNPEGANANWTKDGIAVTNSDAFGITGTPQIIRPARANGSRPAMVDGVSLRPKVNWSDVAFPQTGTQVFGPRRKP